MMNISRLRHTLSRLAGPLLLAGLAAVAWDSWRDRQRNRAQSRSAPPAPALPDSGAWPCQPTVSVLVAAWNEADGIETHLRSFRDLHYPHKQLVLCAGGSDDTYAIAARWQSPQVRVIEQRPGEGKQRALRRCLPHASGEIIMLTDADCLYSDEAFLRLIEPLATNEAAVATGYSEPIAALRAEPLVQYQWFTDLVWIDQLPPTVDGVLGRNCAMRRAVVEQLRPFDAEAATGTDYVLSRLLTRAGCQIRAVAGSRVATRYPATPEAYLRMWRRWNKNLLLHGLRFGAQRDVRGVLVAFAFYALILGLPLLALLLGPIALVPSLTLFGLAFARRWRRVAAGAALARSSLSPRLSARMPLYVMLDMLAVCLAMYDAVRPARRGRW